MNRDSFLDDQRFSMARRLLRLFWMLGALLATPIAQASGDMGARSAHNDKTLLEVHSSTGPVVIWALRDKTVAPRSQATKVELLAELPGAAVVMADTYPSAAGGMSYCQERTIRIRPNGKPG